DRALLPCFHREDEISGADQVRRELAGTVGAEIEATGRHELPRPRVRGGAAAWGDPPRRHGSVDAAVASPAREAGRCHRAPAGLSRADSEDALGHGTVAFPRSKGAT